MNHFLLHLLVKDIAPPVAGSQVRSIRLMSPIVSIELRGRAETGHLVVILATPGPFCFYDSKDPLGSAGTVVFKRIENLRVSRDPDLPVDRVIHLPLATGGDETTLAVYLYGSSAKVRLLSRTHIVESLDPQDSGMPISEIPAPPGEPFSSISAARLSDALRGDAKTVTGLAPELAHCFAACDGAIDTDALVAFRDALLAGETEFHLGTNKRVGRVVPIPSGCRDLSNIVHSWGPFTTARQACATVGRSMITTAHRLIIERHRNPLRKHLANRKRLLESLRQNLRDAQAYDVGRSEADILAAFQSQIAGGVSEVELPDLYSAGNVRKIKLDPAVPIAEQIQKRYKRAAKLERSRDILERRIRDIESDISRLMDTLRHVEKDVAFEQALAQLQAAAREYGVDRQARRRRGADTSVKRYRRFDLDDTWFVLVGRNDRENDEITFRLSGPEDIWLHAQQSPGSHVVLRSSGAGGNPPKAILEAAAAVAAFYSRARHSKLVPVIYTRRKYVRKFRGAKPGEVRCEREKTIFAEPRVPKG